MKIYNTLTRQKEEFVTVDENEVKIYVCGPTVYNYIHIGNARPIVIFDTLRRYLLYKGMDVKYVSNFTDIDDKIIELARKENVPFTDITERYIAAFLKDTAALNVMEEHTIHPKATEYVPQMVDFVQDLIDKGAAYEVNGNVYFDISSVKDYGKLSKRNVDDLMAGARIDKNDEKKNPMDFTLWKAKKEEWEPAWDSPWGPGRPGWHIECSVMSQDILGDTIDIHAGGEDLQFPHHENEIAQSETATGQTFAKYWMHNGMINVDNEKMSKSLGNFFLVREVLEYYTGEEIRLWLLSAHYRTPINFSDEVMEATKASLERLYNAKAKLERLLKSPGTEENQDILDSFKAIEGKFIMAMDDDLNTAQALGEIFDLVSIINTEINESIGEKTLEDSLETLERLTGVLGLLNKEGDSIDEQIEALIQEREEARASKDWARADEIRDKLLADGIELRDTSTGVVWKKV